MITKKSKIYVLVGALFLLFFLVKNANAYCDCSNSDWRDIFHSDILSACSITSMSGASNPYQARLACLYDKFCVNGEEKYKKTLGCGNIAKQMADICDSAVLSFVSDVCTGLNCVVSSEKPKLCADNKTYCNCIGQNVKLDGKKIKEYPNMNAAQQECFGPCHISQEKPGRFCICANANPICNDFTNKDDPCPADCTEKYKEELVADDCVNNKPSSSSTYQKIDLGEAISIDQYKKQATDINPMKFSAGKSGVLELIGRIGKALTYAMGSILFALYIYAGILWMTSSGNSEKTGMAKKIVVWSTLGVIVQLSAYIIVSMLFKFTG